MKNLFFTFLFVAMMAGTSFAQGFGGGISLSDDVGIQARYEFDLSAVENLEIAPNFTYFFVDGGTFFSINGDGHYDFALGESGDLVVYPLAGLNWSRASAGGFSSSDIGLNIGGGVNYNLSGIRLFGEVKHTTTGIGNEFIDLGVLFNLN